MGLTEEQKQILSCTNNGIIIVNALAGTGKTSTLLEWCKQKPHLKILYLVFGKAMADEAKKMFKDLKNVHVKTTHSLAFKSFGVKYKSKLTQSYRAIDCMRDLDLNGDYDTANSVLSLFNKFLSSDSDDIYKFTQTILRGYGIKNEHKINSLSKLCDKLWKKSIDLNDDTQVVHDFYLKLYQMSKPNLGLEYDVMLIDEAQDSTMTIKGIIDSSKDTLKQTIIIGDPHQSIFQFRNCVNLIEIYSKEATNYDLTGSFRVNQNIANMCNMLLDMFKRKKVHMNGYNKNQKIYSDKGLNFENMQSQFNIITRTNATILAHAIEASMRGKWLYFEGGYNSYPFQFYKDLYWFRATNQTYNKELNKFKDWEELQQYATEADDIELLTGIKFINMYSSKVDSLPNAIDNVKNYVVSKREQANFCYCTAHKSKGLTFETPTLIEKDFPHLIDWQKTMTDIISMSHIYPDALDKFLKDIEQDVNLTYVAITRAKGDIYLNEDMVKFFNL